MFTNCMTDVKDDFFILFNSNNMKRQSWIYIYTYIYICIASINSDAVFYSVIYRSFSNHSDGFTELLEG